MERDAITAGWRGRDKDACAHTVSPWTGPTKGGFLIFRLQVSTLFTGMWYQVSLLMLGQEVPEQGPTRFPPLKEQIMEKIFPYRYFVQAVVGFAWHRGTACLKSEGCGNCWWPLDGTNSYSISQGPQSGGVHHHRASILHLEGRGGATCHSIRLPGPNSAWNQFARRAQWSEHSATKPFVPCQHWWRCQRCRPTPASPMGASGQRGAELRLRAWAQAAAKCKN